MRSKEDVTLAASLRHAPVRTGLVAVVPVVLGIVQLLNGLFTNLSVLVGVAFAAMMIASAVVFTRHHLAQLRLEVLETRVHTQSAD
ncbi:hypothetical protein L593_12370 [Salinarchaeum sp. Harcht-Bsk1]|uniref:hypothetical protein n=1 Tax=Salinarchaeum sp. Harcht-Bsk1 TaxID=1333523 RepID=UPI0003422C0B|nr:hypothetical protein [Salinarchaeum sp. Harcht-Bsk1]AGN02413.1 hypothetical protein L593_12370 [Salinarchaeum sp. Harcht-Bsk1]